ncbi:hypothetical protein LMG9673_03498 [Ralstonia pseudosolanacearum]|nr:hypothetical protein LMG9673_03498 [Ralstonia pseudosolanacearum]
MRACPGQMQSLWPATPGTRWFGRRACTGMPVDHVARVTRPSPDAPFTVVHVDRINDGIDTLTQTTTAEDRLRACAAQR